MKAIAVLLFAAIALLAEGNSTEIDFKQASAALASADYPAAERGFVKVLSLTPNDFAALSNLGVVYSRMGRPGEAAGVYERAASLFERALRHAPANDQASRLLSACEIYTGAVASAIVRLERLRTGSPLDEGVLYLLAVAYGKQNRPDDAKALLGEILQNASPVKKSFLLARSIRWCSVL